MLPAALLFDLDGTLVETEHLWQRAQKEVFESLGGTWSAKLNERLMGAGLLWGAELMADLTASERSASSIGEQLLDRMVQLVQDGGAYPRPGAVGALRLAARLQIPVAIVTSSYRTLAVASLAALERSKFELIVTGDQVKKPKPDPEAYLLAAQQLGVPISRSVAFEDSPVGIESALLSGAATVAVQNHAAIEALPGLLYLDSLEDVTEDWLRSVL